jgi:hypothetical protein
MNQPCKEIQRVAKVCWIALVVKIEVNWRSYTDAEEEGEGGKEERKKDGGDDTATYLTDGRLPGSADRTILFRRER